MAAAGYLAGASRRTSSYREPIVDAYTYRLALVLAGSRGGQALRTRALAAASRSALLMEPHQQAGAWSDTPKRRPQIGDFRTNV